MLFVAPTRLFRYAGWSAYGSTAVLIVGAFSPIVIFVLRDWGMVFFGLYELIWTIDVTTTVIFPISMVPVALALHRVWRDEARSLSLLALAFFSLQTLVIGIFGVLNLAGLQQVVPRPFSMGSIHLRAGTSFGAVGVWLLITGYLVLTRGKLPSRLAWLSIIAGAGFAVSWQAWWLDATGLPPFLYQTLKIPMSITGGFVALIAYPLWAVWLGRRLLDETVTPSG